jgi:hypothetical protein
MTAAVAFGSGLALRPAYIGKDHLEARYAEQRARVAGLSTLRARVVGQIASFTDGWVFRETIAKFLDCSVRTVQRAITQAREEGLLNTARAKKKEVPPGRAEPLPCGWSHRWIIGRGLAAAALLAAVTAAKLARLAVRTVRPRAELPRPARDRPPPRRWTAAELDAALEASPVGKPPDVPDPG